MLARLAAPARVPLLARAVSSSSSALASTSTSPATASSSSSRPPAIKAETAPTPVWEHHVPLEPSHGYHVATLHLRAYDDALADLSFFTNFALRSARALGLPTTGAAALPTSTWLRTVPRSPFVHKKSQQNFWRRTHKRAIKVFDGDEEVVQAWLAYLRKEAFPGVGMKAQYFTYRQVGWGKDLVSDQELDQLALGGGSNADGVPTDAQIQQLAAEAQRELEADLADAQKSGAPSPSGGIDAEPTTPPRKQELEEVAPEQQAAAAASSES
ncbi:hypothetical protein C6P46_000934 [Rhodotorula mucilaginosa]|uniref:Small ribosomal subunit protein uS10m n=1 Tax=Rhodotorula mucilaginosa TaxID=5537 RepID=A0A9P6W528_RHOMI|nr:hypothetical protein C6P46_000934 [Rhodotorula mucilaginosa]